MNETSLAILMEVNSFNHHVFISKMNYTMNYDF